MIRKALVGVILSLASVASNAGAVGVEVDQSQAVVDMARGGLGIGGTSQQKIAQVVTAGREGVLTEVRLAILCLVGHGVDIEIQAVTGDVPDGEVLGRGKFQQIVAVSDVVGIPLPTEDSGPFKKIVVTPVPLAVGTKFAIVLSSEDSSSCGMHSGPVGNPYAGGDAFFDARPSDTGWVPISFGPSDPSDIPFETVMLVP